MRASSVRGLLVCVFTLFAVASNAAPPTTKQSAAPPDFQEVVRAVGTYFNSLPNFQAGDLISRAQINGALSSVRSAGWDVPDADEIVQLGLPDNSFLITRLSTPAGRRFMRKIAMQPGGYSQLDRLSSIPRGQALVNDLIRSKGGDEFIAYMATTKHGRQLGRQLAAIPDGVDPNKPTGRIYTADDLLAELKRVHEANAR